MKAPAYIVLNHMRADLKNNLTELRVTQGGLWLCVLLSVASCFTGETMAIVAAALTMTIPVTAMCLINKRILSIEEEMFQHRIKHSNWAMK